jgi:hypothetical protein
MGHSDCIRQDARRCQLGIKIDLLKEEFAQKSSTELCFTDSAEAAEKYMELCELRKDIEHGTKVMKNTTHDGCHSGQRHTMP